jgi:hypothetical protein
MISSQYQNDLDKNFAAKNTANSNLVSAQLTLQGLTALTFSASKQRKVMGGKLS